MTLQSIGDEMMGRDHSTMINAVKVVEDWFAMPTMYQNNLKVLKGIEDAVK